MGRNKILTDPRDLDVTLDGETYDKLARIADLTTKGNKSKVVRVTLQNYLDYAVDHLMADKI